MTEEQIMALVKSHFALFEAASEILALADAGYSTQLKKLEKAFFKAGRLRQKEGYYSQYYDACAAELAGKSASQKAKA